MDNDMWLVESADSVSKRLCSPGATSSGYCSSEEMLLSGSTSNTFKQKSTSGEQPLSVDSRLSTRVGKFGCDDAPDIAKTNTTFDGFADSLWEPLSASAAEDGRSDNLSVPQRHVYRGLMAKQLAPSRKQPGVGDNSETDFKIGQTISVWNRHVASELGNPFAQTVDDCRTMYKRGSLQSDDMSVDVTVSTKRECSSSKSPTVIIRPVARIRGAAPIVSCSTVLRRSATVPSKMPLVAGKGLVTQTGTSKSDHMYSHQPHVVHAESTPSIHEALRDHMYALKVPPPTPVHSSCTDLSNSSRSRKGSSRSDAAANRGGMSILEAFLRSATPCFDANRGSTAIAAEELRKLNVYDSIFHPSVKVYTGAECDDSTQTGLSTQSLLKQLLTSESNNLDLDQSECSDSDSHSPRMAVDSVLTDGFGLDADLQLDDPLSNGIGLLEDDCTDNCVTVDIDDSALVSQFIHLN